MPLNARYLWAIEILNIQSQDRILEIGCGTGILVELMAEKLSDGHITAIDPSAAQLAKARKRNEAALASGTVSFIEAAFLDTRFARHGFDKICAFNVNFFWTRNAARELELVKHYLAPDGMLYLLYQSPGGSEDKVLAPVQENLYRQRFQVVEVLQAPGSSASACCIRARP